MTIEKRLERLEAIVDARGLDWDHPRVVDEPAKEPEPEHPAGPKPDPGEGYRILKKNPPEELQPRDEYENLAGQWRESLSAHADRKQDTDCWYRRKIETPEPAWEPKVGDWVLVRRPEDWKEWKNPLWPEELHIYNGKVFQVRGAFDTSVGHRVTLHGCEWFFHRDWLSPATTSQPLKIPPLLATVSGSGVRDSKPAETQYRIPSLPDDAGKACEFSDDGQRWLCKYLEGWLFGRDWVSSGNFGWKHCRIKKDA